MKLVLSSLCLSDSRRRFSVCVLVLTLIGATWYFRALLKTSATLFILPLVWNYKEAQALISEADHFDLTFANYSRQQTTAGDPYVDVVPPVIHHIALGITGLQPAWHNARQSCLDLHPEWEAHLWTDDNAAKFVAERFPSLKDTWEGYQYPIQRVDALRYLVLYHFGGECETGA